jgi:hypothetical protein
VLSTAVRVGVTATALLGVPGRVLVLMDRAEAAVTRLEQLLESVRATADRAGEVADRAGDVADRAGEVADRAGEVADRAEDVVGDVDRVSRLAGVIAADSRGVVAGASEAQEAVATLVQAYEPTLATLHPTLTLLAETMDPREVSALVGLVDRLPPLLDSVDEDVLPLLRRLNEMAPDLHSLLGSVDDLRRTVAGLPGIGLLRRRGDGQLAGDEEPDPEPFLPDPEARGATRAGT